MDEFIEYLETNITNLRLVRAHEFQNHANYNYEMFALKHQISTDGCELRKPILQSVENYGEWLGYIEERALSTTNSVLRSRYNDILWVYRKEGSAQSIRVGNVKDKCELAISDYIELAKSRLLRIEDDKHLLYNLTTYLFRPWCLTKQINSAKKDSLIQIMIDVEATIEEDGKIGLWGFSYENLIKNTSVTLSDEQKREVIQLIDRRVNRLDLREFHPLMHGVTKLLEYYRDDPKKQLEYLDILEKSAELGDEMPFRTQYRYEQLIKLYHKYDFKERKEMALINYQKHGKEIVKNLAKIERGTEISRDTHQTLLNLLYNEDHQKHLMNITYNFFRNNRKEAERLKSKEERMSYIKTITSNGNANCNFC